MSLGFPPTATGASEDQTTGWEGCISTHTALATCLSKMAITIQKKCHSQNGRLVMPFTWTTSSKTPRMRGKHLSSTNRRVHPTWSRAAERQYQDIRLGNPRRTGPDTNRHPDVAGQHHLFRCAEAVLGKHRGRHFVPSRPPLGNQPLPGCLAVRGL